MHKPEQGRLCHGRGKLATACPSMRSVLLKTALISRFFPTLTDQDLEKLGVLLGDRRKMLRAIARLEAIDAELSVRRGTATPRVAEPSPRRTLPSAAKSR